MGKMKKLFVTSIVSVLTLSGLGFTSAEAAETKASILINDGEITHTLPSQAISFTEHSFNFGSYFGGTDYDNVATSESSLELNVNDQRSLNGITTGWKVTAALSSFSSSELSGRSLGEGTKISFLNGTPENVKDYVGELTQPEVGATIELNVPTTEITDTTTNIWSADRGENKLLPVGVDEWTLTYANDAIKLFIPHDELVSGTHTATITWTSTNAN